MTHEADNLPALVASHPGLRLLWGDDHAGVIALGEGTAGGYLHVTHIAGRFRVYRRDRRDRVVDERSNLERDEVVRVMAGIAGLIPVCWYCQGRGEYNGPGWAPDTCEVCEGIGYAEDRRGR